MIKLGNIKYETIAPTKEQLIIYVPAGTYLCDLYTNLGSIPLSGFRTVEDIKLVLDRQ